jgi:hypothetical protein
MTFSLAPFSTPTFTAKKTHGKFADRFSGVSILEVSGGLLRFSAFVYMCRLNLDKDGSWNSYGYDNPAKGSIQKNLHPLESSPNQISGLGNACGDPGDGTKGWKNFLVAKNRNFYWAGVMAMTTAKAHAQNLLIDDRPVLEAGLETYAEKGKTPTPLPVGSGFFPLVNPNTGYYISGTSLHADGSASAYSPKRYLDSTVVPYAVWANHWASISLGGKKLHLGDFGMAIENNTGTSIGFVYGDSGTPDKVGECSQKLHQTLGGGAGLVTFIAFPGSGSGQTVKGGYIPSPLGPSPQAVISSKVSQLMFRLYPNGADLAALLSMGPELSVPAGKFASPDQARLYKNFTAALSRWI